MSLNISGQFVVKVSGCLRVVGGEEGGRGEPLPLGHALSLCVFNIRPVSQVLLKNS